MWRGPAVRSPSQAEAERSGRLAPGALLLGPYLAALGNLTADEDAAVYYGAPVARVGTERVLERLTPYENSNRIPLIVVDHLVPDLEGGAAPAVPGAAPDPLEPLGLPGGAAPGAAFRLRRNPLRRPGRRLGRREYLPRPMEK